MAAAENIRDLLYFTFGDENLRDRIYETYSLLVDHSITVGTLYKVSTYLYASKENENSFSKIILLI